MNKDDVKFALELKGKKVNKLILICAKFWTKSIITDTNSAKINLLLGEDRGQVEQMVILSLVMPSVQSYCSLVLFTSNKILEKKTVVFINPNKAPKMRFTKVKKILPRKSSI